MQGRPRDPSPASAGRRYRAPRDRWVGGPLPGLGTLRAVEVPGEQEDPAARDWCSPPPDCPGRCGRCRAGEASPSATGGPHWERGTDRAVGSGSSGAIKGVVRVPGCFVKPLPRHAQPCQSLLEHRLSRGWHAVEPQPLPPQRLKSREPETTPGFQFSQTLLQIKQPVIGSALLLAVGEGLGHGSVKIKRLSPSTSGGADGARPSGAAAPHGRVHQVGWRGRVRPPVERPVESDACSQGAAIRRPGCSGHRSGRRASPWRGGMSTLSNRLKH